MSNSKRKHPKRLCANPSCKKEFIPTDKRQIYCCAQCRIDAGNDRRDLRNRTIFFDEKRLRHYEKMLAKLFKVFFTEGKLCTVHKLYLQYEGINVKYCVEEQTNSKSEMKIKWFYEFGIEIYKDDPNFFIIHKRPKS